MWVDESRRSSRASGSSFKASYGSAWLAAREVIVRLEIQPQVWRRAESSREQPCGFGGDSSASACDFVDPLERDPDVRSERDLCDAERLEEFLKQNLAGMGGGAVGGDHVKPSRGSRELEHQGRCQQPIGTPISIGR